MADLEELSQRYLSLRRDREILKERYVEQDSVLEKEMTQIEEAMITELNAANASSISTKNATILRRVTKRYDPANCWDEIYALIDKHKAFGLLHKRVHDGNMSTFLEEHPEEYPAKLKLDSRYAVTVKRKSGE